MEDHEFKTATWNVFHDSPIRLLKPIAESLVQQKVSLLFLQEATDKDIVLMLEDLGLQCAHEGQFITARDPSRWSAPKDGELILLSRTPFFGARGQTRYSEALKQRLIDLNVDRVLKTVNVHTPAHIQVQDPDPRRVKAAIESAEKWGRMANLFDEQHYLDALMISGDDNVDESGAFMERLRAFKDRATGLRSVQPPGPSFRNRKIDQFRIKGSLRPMHGYMVDGAYQREHRIHVRKFAWV